MSKVRRRLQFKMSSLLILLTLSCVGVGVCRLIVPPTVEVLVAAQPLDFGHKIRKSDFILEEVPVSNVPVNAFRDEEVPVGNVLMSRYRTGGVLIQSDVTLYANWIESIMPHGTHAVTIHEYVSCDVWGLLCPGDRVDVMCVDGDGKATFVVGDLLVLQYQNKGRELVFELAVTDRNELAITNAQETGALRVVLRADRLED